MDDRTSRAIFLLRVAASYIKRYAGQDHVRYDGCVCSGGYLAEDCERASNDLMFQSCGKVRTEKEE